MSNVVPGWRSDSCGRACQRSIHSASRSGWLMMMAAVAAARSGDGPLVTQSSIIPS